MNVEILLRNGSTVFPCTEPKVVEDRIKLAVTAKAWGITVEDYDDRRMLIPLDAIDYVLLDRKED